MHRPVGVRFKERMRGFIACGERDCARGAALGRGRASSLELRLTLATGDVDRFVSDPMHEMSASGSIVCPVLGGERPIESGTCRILVDAASRPGKEMTYELRFHDADGRPLVLIGTKEVEDDSGFDVWRDTTTLYTKILDDEAGSGDDDGGGAVVAAGIVRLTFTAFLGQLRSFRASGRHLPRRLAGLVRFLLFFLGGLWRVYGPKRKARPRRASAAPRIPRHTLEGVPNAEVSTHYVTTRDGLGLSMLRFRRSDCDDVVLLLHGLTSSSDMFIMPEHTNLVSYLLDAGFTDVWCFDNRMSSRHSYNLHRHRYNFDDVALFDYPPALAEIRKHVGRRRLHVVCHCLGSLTFTMSLFAKAVDDVTSVVSNSVALTPRISWWSRVKLAVAPFLVEYVLSLPYVDPGASRDPGFAPGEILSRLVSLFHPECDEPACHMLSMMWGNGRPALFEHENLDERTHRRLPDLFGGTSMHYYRHVRAMLRAGNEAVKYAPHDPKYAAAPQSYLAFAPQIETPILFLSGDRNRVFTDSNVLCWQRLEREAPGRHRLHVLPGYGHQDVFMGRRAHEDVFPLIVAFLREQSAAGTPVEGARRAG